MVRELQKPRARGGFRGRDASHGIDAAGTTSTVAAVMMVPAAVDVRDGSGGSTSRVCGASGVLCTGARGSVECEDGYATHLTAGCSGGCDVPTASRPSDVVGLAVEGEVQSGWSKDRVSRSAAGCNLHRGGPRRPATREHHARARFESEGCLETAWRRRRTPPRPRLDAPPPTLGYGSVPIAPDTRKARDAQWRSRAFLVDGPRGDPFGAPID